MRKRTVSTASMVWQLRAAAVSFLRYERHCPLVCLERSPFGSHKYRPDVVGVTTSRHVLEAEVKVTMDDFRANQDKPYVRHGWRPDTVMCRKQFWFIVPGDMADEAKAELPPGAGLLVPVENHYWWSARVVHPAQVNKDAVRLSTKMVVAMAKAQSGTVASLCRALAHVTVQP